MAPLDPEYRHLLPIAIYSFPLYLLGVVRKRLASSSGLNLLRACEAQPFLPGVNQSSGTNMDSSIYCDEVYGANMIARAQRFPIRAIMHYRIVGENRWYVGTVENMSSTGVLFRGERVMDLNSSIEVTVNVPGSLAAGHSSKMVSRGKIVRVLPGIPDPECAVMAASLIRLRILRD
jgi:hypothetical protein